MRRVLPIRALAPVALAVAVLAGCVPQGSPPAPEPPARPVPVPSPQPAPPPPPELGADWRDWPLTPGDWVYRQDARGGIALYGRPGADAALTLRCDRADRAIYLSRAGSGATAFTVRTSTQAKTLPAQPTGGSPAYLATRIAPDDRLLDAMGFSRGRFIVETAGMAPLVVPAWAEVLRIVEDCRD
ncbi:hypothetical protein [Sphingomonas sp.]|uniref:hypothetical protein n=1 Tax=Sphingomonas sp. TaxID=28214 RepID=UPI002CB4FAFB|nr:hypothetical protein [Sphingomonas sp.]HWK35282.1 hypothetical protein [Sphingomonas sp.]